MSKKIVIALGGNALGKTISSQAEVCKETAKAIADLICQGHQVTVCHGNGPQVGMIQKAFTALRATAPEEYEFAPLYTCAAMSQGYIGYDLQNALRSELVKRGIYKTVSTILTQVLVDPYDEAFYEPKKAIGRYMSKEDADIEVNKGNYVTHEAEGYRRVVAAPQPIDIVEIEAIKTLADADQVVIACGGGGIPVIEQQHILKGASAVIEKDCIAGKLASDLQADELLILTSVDYVYLDYGKDSQRPITSMTVAEASDYIKEGQFGETNMLPKIEAAISYLNKVPNGKVVITSLSKTADAINEKVGTIITK